MRLNSTGIVFEFIDDTIRLSSTILSKEFPCDIASNFELIIVNTTNRNPEP